jgi:hypothetical protein
MAADVVSAEARVDAAPSGRARPTVGPLLAVCGLCGGAGTSTLSYLVAADFALSSDLPALVCDTGGPTGGLAAYARVRSTRSLPRLAAAIAEREQLGEGLFAQAEGGLRVIASSPHLDVDADERGVERLLADARAAHRLTVVDCGALRGPVDRLVLDAASHVAWVLPATLSGVRRAGPVLELFGSDPTRKELVVARRDAGERKPPADDLTALAAGRHARLVLMPHVPDLGEEPAARGLEAAQVTLQAIRGVIDR